MCVFPVEGFVLIGLANVMWLQEVLGRVLCYYHSGGRESGVCTINGRCSNVGVLFLLVIS